MLTNNDGASVRGAPTDVATSSGPSGDKIKRAPSPSTEILESLERVKL